MGVLSVCPNESSECNFYNGEITIHVPNDNCWESKKEKSNDLNDQNINNENQESKNSKGIIPNKEKINLGKEENKIEKNEKEIKKIDDNKDINKNYNTNEKDKMEKGRNAIENVANKKEIKKEGEKYFEKIEQENIKKSNENKELIKNNEKNNIENNQLINKDNKNSNDLDLNKNVKNEDIFQGNNIDLKDFEGKNDFIQNYSNKEDNIDKNNINNNIIEQKYFFPLVGLNNIGSTCFMNSTLQCLLHISELSLYFLNEYPKDKSFLESKNKNIQTNGDISKAYYEVLKSVYNLSKKEIKFSYNSYAPFEFKKILGKYNSQFKKSEANDSKDLILYLLQTFHEELNYFGDKTIPKNIPMPDLTSRSNSFNYFTMTYQSTNFSKVSQLFYGTYENVIKCSKCKTIFYSYQKFEFISFSLYNYRNSIFNIRDGFRDNELAKKLEGENQYLCNKCQKLVDAELFTKIIETPLKLIINIDYGKDKINQVQKLIFEHEIDITEFLSFKLEKDIKYQLCAVCSHKGVSGPNGHYIAFCKNKENNKWFKFNDSSCQEVDKYELNRDNPYLLIYEKI